MLVLSRKQQETIVIDSQIRVTVLGIHGNTVKLGIDAPREVAVRRHELIPHSVVALPLSDLRPVQIPSSA